MNLIDREIEKFDEKFPSQNLKTVGGYQFYPNPDKRDIHNFLRQSLQRVIDETKKKCIEALPKEKPSSVTYGEVTYDFDTDSKDKIRIESFNQAIQQAKQNIEEVR